MKKFFILIVMTLIIFLPSFLGNFENEGNIKNISTLNNKYIKQSTLNNEKYEIDIDLSYNKMVIYKEDKIFKEITCMPQKDYSKTPTGTFKIENKGSLFFTSKNNENERYYIKFFSNYLIHSIPADKNGNIIKEGKNKLELPVSSGSISVCEDDSKWLYNNIPVGALVVIH